MQEFRIIMKVYENYSLKKLNSFGLEVKARKFISLDNMEDLKMVAETEFPMHHLILGEGTNLLFSGDFDGTILHPGMKGIEVLSEDQNHVEIEVCSGENWDSFVDYCCQNNFGGLENLSLIPGAVGSAPVQNIGAYGVEVKDRLIWVKGMHLESGEIMKIHNKDCNFGYRESIFKKELKNRFLITSVAFKLDKHPRFSLDYGNVADEFNKLEKQDIIGLRNCIIRIRESKLPDWKEYGNAGSFFKNPVISVEQFARLNDDYPTIPSYPAGDHIKIPAAWLIEKAGWKGRREKQTGTWPSQPLVIVNYGNAKGKEILEFSEKIRESVQKQFDILLEREVSLI